ncbi:MAG: helicase-related protein, partial [Oscillospiraceae bacterium]
DESFLSGLRRRTDIRSGLPNYKYGGNIFEEFDVDEKKWVYQKAAYTPSDVAELRSADKKLDEFLKLTDEVMSQENSRAIVYCCDKNTVEYLRKALTAMYPGSGAVKAARGELFSNRDILRKLNVDDRTTYPKIIIATDDIGAVGDGLDRVTHVINYELPASPALLERRMTRHGAKNENQRSFIIFRDSNKLFDSRMLDKVLFGGLADAFFGDMPARNILLDIDIKAECLSNLIADLRYTESYASEVDNCYDLIKKFKGDYEALGAGKINNAKQLAEFAGKLLAKVCGFYGVSKDASQEDIAAALASLTGLCAVNDGALAPVNSEMLSKIAASLDQDPAGQSFGEEAIAGVEAAHKHIDELHSGSNYHLMIKNDIQSLNDCIQYPVLYGVWRYRVREKDSVRSFKDFIRIYNDGI